MNGYSILSYAFSSHVQIIMRCFSLTCKRAELTHIGWCPGVKENAQCLEWAQLSGDASVLFHGWTWLVCWPGASKIGQRCPFTVTSFSDLCHCNIQICNTVKVRRQVLMFPLSERVWKTSPIELIGKGVSCNGRISWESISSLLII